MDIVCQHCSKKISIPDKKVPKGKAFALACPQCKKKISVDPSQTKKKDAPPKKEAKKQADASVKKADKQSESSPLPAGSKSNGAPSNPFEFLEEGTLTAAICEEDPSIRAQVRAVVEARGYLIQEPESPRETLKQMRFHDYDLIVLNEQFGTRDPDMNHVLKYLSQLNMITRRNMYVVLLSERFRTGDNMQTLNKSVNQIVNLQNMDKFDKILNSGLAEYEGFYGVFKDLLKRIKGV